MGWRVSRGLDQLLAQINGACPGRSKASDGSIGDAAHQGTKSDHNPDSEGVVRARDFTQDPAHGADMGIVSEALRQSRDPRIAYVIFNRRIFSSTVSPWVWRNYTGTSDPHTNHMHVSTVASDSIADSTRPWSIGVGGTPAQGEDMANVSQDEWSGVRDAIDRIERVVTGDATAVAEAGYYPPGQWTVTGTAPDNQHRDIPLPGTNPFVPKVPSVSRTILNRLADLERKIDSAQVTQPTIDYGALAKALIGELTR